VGDNKAVMIAYHTPATTHPDDGALEVASTILGDQPSGRLYKALVDNKKAVTSFTDHAELHDPGFLMAGAILQIDQNLDEAGQTVLKTVEGLAAEPPSKEEVDRAKTKILKQFDLNMTNSERIGLYLTEYSAAGDWRLFFQTRDQVKKVSPEDVVRVAKAYFKESNRTSGQFVPTKNPDRAEIGIAPEAAELLKNYTGGAALSHGESFAPTPSNIESRIIRKKLPGGLKLVMLPKKTRGGVVYAYLNLRFGDPASLSGKATIGQLTGQILIRGNKNQIPPADPG
jgi:zinc protease